MSFARALLQPKSSVTRSGPASRSKCALPRREAYRDHTLKSCTLVERLEIESASFWAYFDDIAGRATNAQNAMANAQLLSRVIRSLMIFSLLVWDARCKLIFDRFLEQICRYHNHARSDAIYERPHRTAWEPPSRALLWWTVLCVCCAIFGIINYRWGANDRAYTFGLHTAGALRNSAWFKVFFAFHARCREAMARGSKYGPKTNFGTHLRLTNRGRNLLRC